MIYINCDDNDITFNKKNYLLRADERLQWGAFKDFRQTTGPQDYILNIEPCGVVLGRKWTGLWHIDVLLNSNYHNHYGVDTVFVSSDQGIYPFPEDKGGVLFQACDPVLHRRRPEIKQEYDFVISGTIGAGVYQKRSDAYDILKSKFNYHDFGKNHKPADYVGMLNTAKVQFICTGRSDPGKGAAAQRFFECLAIGPVLTDWTDDLPLTGLVEGEDFVAYRNEDEMVEKMKLLLGNEDLRNGIASSGRRKALMYHTYEHRLMSIFNFLNEKALISAP